MKQSCIDCGYKMLHLHRDCPMCKDCNDCDNSVMDCECHEGE